MSERSNEHDWKSCDVKASAGSNPVLCANSLAYTHGPCSFTPSYGAPTTIAGYFLFNLSF